MSFEEILTYVTTALGASIEIILVGLIIYYVLLVIAEWRIFKKAGKAGWRSLIPFFREYTLYRICWKPLMYLIALAMAAASGILTTYAGDYAVAAALAWVLDAFILIISLTKQIRLSKAFGHGTAFALGLIFLNPIFMLILGLGSSAYTGAVSSADTD